MRRSAGDEHLVQVRGRGPIPTRVYALWPGLTRVEAQRRAHRLDKRAGYGDHRGFTYNPRTGRAAMT